MIKCLKAPFCYVHFSCSGYQYKRSCKYLCKIYLQETILYFQEEVWEVGAQLLGLSIGVLIMVYRTIKLYLLFILKYLSVCQPYHQFRYCTEGDICRYSFYPFTVAVLYQDTAGVKSSYLTLTLTWLIIRLLHLWLRYQSLSVLKFRTVRCLTQIVFFLMKWNNLDCCWRFSCFTAFSLYINAL
jgi:hypothetical protein